MFSHDYIQLPNHKIIISEGNLNLLSACTYSELCKGEGREVKRRMTRGGGEAEMLIPSL